MADVESERRTTFLKLCCHSLSYTVVESCCDMASSMAK